MIIACDNQDPFETAQGLNTKTEKGLKDRIKRIYVCLNFSTKYVN